MKITNPKLQTEKITNRKLRRYIDHARHVFALTDDELGRAIESGTKSGAKRALGKDGAADRRYARRAKNDQTK